MNQDTYDEELRWRLEALKASLDNGKIEFAAHLIEGVQRSLSAVRYGIDGKIDLTTVDGRIRSLALAAAHLQLREAAKSAISLREISQTYFEFVEKNLGFLKVRADELGLNAHQFAIAASKDEVFVKGIVPQISEFVEHLQGFWEAVGESSHFHIQDLQVSKAVYGGDLFPSYKNNIASTAGLYIDTIVLSDPFFHSRVVLEKSNSEKRAYYFTKHAINLLNYKDIATADTKCPIIIFTPFRSSVDESEVKFLHEIATIDGLKHARKLFGRTFESAEELWEYCGNLSTPKKVVAALTDPKRLLFDTEWHEPLDKQIKRSLDMDWYLISDLKPHAGHLVASQCFARMAQATDVLLKSRYLSGVPLIDAPTSWEYFNWKLEYIPQSNPLTRLSCI
jgi:hypothetical protein